MDIHTRQLRSFLVGIGLIAVVMFIALVQPTLAHPNVHLNFMQPVSETTMQPAEHLSWTAIIAGSIVALIVQLALNLLAVGIGINSLNLLNGESTTTLKTIKAKDLLVTVAITLISLAIGGWMAARFSGASQPATGLQHGVIVWVIVTTLSFILLGTVTSRIMPEIISFLGHGFASMRAAVAKFALATFTVIVMGIFAAGFGGYIGAPQDSPTTHFSTSTNLQPHTASTAAITLQGHYS